MDTTDNDPLNSKAVGVNPLTNSPKLAWEKLKKEQKFRKIIVKIPLTPVSTKLVRFVCISDTHNRKNGPLLNIPSGDVLLHAGDFTMHGSLSEVEAFNKWIGTLDHRYKIVIAGNHELVLDSKICHSVGHKSAHCGQLPVRSKGTAEDTNAKQLLDNCIYLEDNSVQIYGINIYGTPWQPRHLDWAFNLSRGQECLDKWLKIPINTDILLSHTPPVGHGDLCDSGVRAGCVELLMVVQRRVQPKYHVFGHIHEGYGVTTDGTTIFINASSCNKAYQAINDPIVFDFPLPTSYSKD